MQGLEVRRGMRAAGFDVAAQAMAARLLTSGRLGAACAVSLVLLAATAAVTESPLAWDGSHYLFRLINEGSVFVPFHRYTAAAWQAPAMLTWWATGSLAACRFVYCATLAAVPLLAFAASFWMLRERTESSPGEATASRDDLLPWVAVGVTFPTLPAQIFFVGESVQALQLCWPLIVAAAVRPTRARVAVASVWTVALVFLHPYSALGIGTAALVALRNELWPRRGRVITALVLLVTALTRVLWLDAVESRRVARGAQDLLRFFSAGAPVLPNLLILAALSLVVLVGVIERRRLASAGTWAAAACGIVAAVLLVFFYSDPTRWREAYLARYALPLVAAPTFGIFLASRWLPRRDRAASREASASPEASARMPLRLVALALCALVTLAVSFQSITWSATVSRVLAAFPPGCADGATVRRLPRQARLLNHWSISPLSLVHGNNDAGAPVLIHKGTCASVACSGRYWASPNHRVGVTQTPFAALASVLEDPAYRSACASSLNRQRRDPSIASPR